MKDILYEWNPWWIKENRFNLVKREYMDKIKPWLKNHEIIGIIGARRSGKTTLLYEIIDYLIFYEKIKAENILFIKADDDRVDTNNLIDNAINEYYKEINPKGNIFIFVDELQEIEKWGRTIKRIYDLNTDIKIIISGSNSTLLREELGTELAGRHSYFELFPFTFREYLDAKNISIKGKKEIEKNKKDIKHAFLKFLNEGGFPEIVLQENIEMKKELIKYYFDSIFYRDIIKKKNIRNPAKMERLVKYFLQNIGCLANFTKIGKMLELTTDSVVEYNKALEDAYLIFNINLFEFSYKKQIINPKKTYCIDNGIRNITGFVFSNDKGRLYENTVFISLRRKFGEIYYWKNKNECDFIIKKGRELKAIQICYDLEKTKGREINGLIEACKEFKLKEGLVITEDYEGEEKIENVKIKYSPLWRWLLEQ